MLSHGRRELAKAEPRLEGALAFTHVRYLTCPQRAKCGVAARRHQHQSRRPWRHLFFLAVSAARRAAHTGHEADGNTAVSVPSPGRRNAGIVPWTSVPSTYSHSVNTSGSRVLRLRRSTRSKASRRSIMLLQVLRRLDQSSIEFCPYFRCHSSRPSTGGSSTT
jgi:hypothetical protein